MGAIRPVVRRATINRAIGSIGILFITVIRFETLTSIELRLGSIDIILRILQSFQFKFLRLRILRRVALTYLVNSVASAHMLRRPVNLRGHGASHLRYGVRVAILVAEAMALGLSHPFRTLPHFYSDSVLEA